MLGVLRRQVVVVLGLVVVKVGQVRVSPDVFRVVQQYLVEECRGLLERLCADVTLPVQHVLHLLEAGLPRQLEQLVDGHAKVGGDGGQQRDVRQAGLRLT